MRYLPFRVSALIREPVRLFWKEAGLGYFNNLGRDNSALIIFAPTIQGNNPLLTDSTSGNSGINNSLSAINKKKPFPGFQGKGFLSRFMVS
jgi:hypothetical protein